MHVLYCKVFRKNSFLTILLRASRVARSSVFFNTLLSSSGYLVSLWWGFTNMSVSFSRLHCLWVSAHYRMEKFIESLIWWTIINMNWQHNQTTTESLSHNESAVTIQVISHIQYNKPPDMSSYLSPDWIHQRLMCLAEEQPDMEGDEYSQLHIFWRVHCLSIKCACTPYRPLPPCSNGCRAWIGNQTAHKKNVIRPAKWCLKM